MRAEWKIGIVFIVLIFSMSGLVAHAGPGDECKSAGDAAYNACVAGAQPAQSVDGAAPGAAPSGPGINPQSTQGCQPMQNQAPTAGQGAQNCKQAQDACQQKCNSTRKQVAQLCEQQDPQSKEECPKQQQAQQQGESKCTQISDPQSQLAQTASTNSSGNSQCKQTDGKSGAPPAIPPPPSSSSAPDTPTPTDTPTDMPTPTATPSTCQDNSGNNGIVSPTGSCVISYGTGTDAGGVARFATTGTTTGAALPEDSTTTTTTGTSGGPIAGAGGIGSPGGGAGSGAPGSPGSSTGAGTSLSKSKEEDPFTKSTRVSDPKSYSSGMEVNSSGGGGSSGRVDDFSLPDFLPGHSKDPKRSTAALAAGKAAANLHPDIVSKYSPLFDQVSKHMQMKCQMKELIGCD